CGLFYAYSAGVGYSAGAILVLFILLVIISSAFVL
ncbi:YjcZ family sporulation protein, partial [Paenibacillus ferrarius]